jgi:hypothetical protein|tara:strand:+ start:161 stop:385 length:225 start_codon:yes stop_codon:yes gene_type:complete
MIPPMLLRFILPKVLDHLLVVFKLDEVLDYVEKPNELDKKVEQLEDKIIELERFAHEPKEFVNCDTCKCKIKES